MNFVFAKVNETPGIFQNFVDAEYLQCPSASRYALTEQIVRCLSIGS